jgi:hypothetical protein
MSIKKNEIDPSVYEIQHAKTPEMKQMLLQKYGAIPPKLTEYERRLCDEYDNQIVVG